VTRPPAVSTGHVRLDPSFVEKHEPAYVQPTLLFSPELSPVFNIVSLLLTGVQRFF
jgi:hypothetical protein